MFAATGDEGMAIRRQRPSTAVVARLMLFVSMEEACYRCTKT
jgi:hypothetical protein